jgi:nitrate reductase delta subunit
VSAGGLLCKVTAHLLRYPDEAWWSRLDEIRQVVRDLPRSGEREALERFLAAVRAEDPMDLQEEYVRRFDLAEETTLHLTARAFGPEKERTVRPRRGLALVQLQSAYRESGMDLEAGELPDFLPVLLEFVAESGCPPALRGVLPALLRCVDEVYGRLMRLGSVYAPVVGVAHSALDMVRRARGEGP